ncbi:MAG: DUF1588 domain-containing protein [Polyangiales bacterium]
MRPSFENGSPLAHLALCFVLTGCVGSIGDGPGIDASVDGGDGGTPLNGCTESQASLQRRVGAWIETTCSHAGCHGPVGALRPVLSAASLPALAASGAFDADGRVMRRIDPEDPSRIMPPTRHENPAEVIAMIERWVEEGTRTDCIDLPAELAAAPNSLDQDELFTCTAPAPWAPSHALLSRDEFVHRAGGSLQDAPLRATPLAPGAPYSTQTQDHALNSTTLGLHIDALMLTQDFRRDRERDNSPNRLWMRGLEEGQRSELDCIMNGRRSAEEVLADTLCKERYLTLLLERHSFQRRPTEAELQVLRPFLDEELMSETEQAHRPRTLAHILEASMMMYGSLHRSAVGNEAGELQPDEWSLALASALSTASPNNASANEAVQRPELAWTQNYWRERDAGTLASVADATRFMASILDPSAGYVGGVVPADSPTARPDIFYDFPGARIRRRRGRHWLAPRIASFFREFFDYGDAAGVAKNDPSATSRWDADWVNRFSSGAINGGYGFAQTGTSPNRPPHTEPPMVDQLDDFIAKTVLESEERGADVLAALLTSREYRVPASVAGNFEGYRSFPTGPCDPVECDGTDCCGGDRCMLTGFESDGSPQGQCMRPSFRELHFVGAVYNVPIIEEARELYDADDSVVMSSPEHDARWVQMPSSERAGVLTHPTWLTAHGGNSEASASAVLRGHWIREHLFCEDVGGLDLVNLEAQLDPPEDNDRARDLLIRTFGDLSLPRAERTSGDARCSNGACHGRMNNLGLAFEVFNHAGFVREDDHGQPPDGSARISQWPGRDAVEVRDALELTQLLSEDPHVRRCFLRHVFRYFAGRFETPADACVLSAMESGFAEGSFFGALEALLTHESFLVRQSGEER